MTTTNTPDPVGAAFKRWLAIPEDIGDTHEEIMEAAYREGYAQSRADLIAELRPVAYAHPSGEIAISEQDLLDMGLPRDELYRLAIIPKE